MIKLKSIIVGCLFLSLNAASQTGASYSFIVAGHGYGAHAGTNKGLHPAFLNMLPKAISDDVFALFLTGDIVNESTTANWVQVKTELENCGIPSYYVMGNHDANSAGYAAFNEKHGGTFYSFGYLNDCFIVLNSTKSDRSISADQLEFMKQTLQNAVSDTTRVFIFFHEVLWNSDAKYKDVLSNSRSRYAQIKTLSNFWTDFYPILSAYRDNRFYLFAGDVGGNTDAVSAFYDLKDNVTLLASGMGEVADENYLNVEVSSDTVTFTFIPLRNEQTMQEAPFYNVPDVPGKIEGQVLINEGITMAEYYVEPVFNATSYKWHLPAQITGESTAPTIRVAFDVDFTSDTIAVSAVHYGYGTSPRSKLFVQSQFSSSAACSSDASSFDFTVSNQNGKLLLSVRSRISQELNFSLFDFQGRCLQRSQEFVASGSTEITLQLLSFQSPVLVVVTNGKEKRQRKIL